VTTVETNIEKLLATDRAWSDAARGNDIDRICSFWSHDAVLFDVFGSGKNIAGIDNIRELVTRRRATVGRSLFWTPVDGFVSGDGDIGATRGTFEVTAPDEKGELVTTHGTYFNVWRKTESEEWKCVFETHG